MQFKIHYSIKRDNTVEDGSRSIEADTPTEAVETFRKLQSAANGATLIIRKVKVVK